MGKDYTQAGSRKETSCVRNSNIELSKQGTGSEWAKRTLSGAGACCRHREPLGSVHQRCAFGTQWWCRWQSQASPSEGKREDSRTVGRATVIRGHGGCCRRSYTAGWQMMALKGTDSSLSLGKISKTNDEIKTLWRVNGSEFGLWLWRDLVFAVDFPARERVRT